MKIKLAILDSDRNYLEKMHAAFIRRYSDKLEIYLFTSAFSALESLAASKSAWKCLSCFACIERCPRNVQPGKLIDAARQILIRQRGQEGLSPDAIPALLDEEMPQQLLMSAFRKYRR